MTNQEAIEYMKAYRHRLTQSISNGLDKDIEAFDMAIKALEQEPKTGHWIDSSNGWMCSECNKDNTYDTDYCPNCGAKMVEPQESEDKR